MLNNEALLAAQATLDFEITIYVTYAILIIGALIEMNIETNNNEGSATDS
ncbi:hypothetical protein JCM19235_2293 [Vibrio maritimus]|uniref:Uncharacterized protein n=1 Tax=Vibrio maritimus TaxID=990268 RepID=A0A090RTW9_9VIBR|nr:hypothetical protein JCM19235_2293 [Vibrio maritimus]